MSELLRQVSREMGALLAELRECFVSWGEDLERRAGAGEFGKWPWQEGYGLWPWQRRRGGRSVDVEREAGE